MYLPTERPACRRQNRGRNSALSPCAETHIKTFYIKSHLFLVHQKLDLSTPCYFWVYSYIIIYSYTQHSTRFMGSAVRTLVAYDMPNLRPGNQTHNIRVLFYLLSFIDSTWPKEFLEFLSSEGLTEFLSPPGFKPCLPPPPSQLYMTY